MIRTLLLGLAALVLALPRAAHAQRTSEEWVEVHAHDAASQAGAARGAIPLLRLWAQRDWVSPVLLADRLHALATPAHTPALRRALAAFLESDVRHRLGQDRAAEAIVHDLGFITHWQVIGPFDNEGRRGFAQVQPPEAHRTERLDPSVPYDGKERAVRWRAFPEVSQGGFVALDAVARPSQNACAFAHTSVIANADARAVLWLGAGGQLRVYVNGVDVFRDEAVRGPFPDRAGVAVALHRGANRVLVKVCTDEHDLGFYARLTHADGTPAPELRIDADPAVAPELRAVAGARAETPRVEGVLTELRALAEAPHAGAQALEDLARFLALTFADDTATPTAADLAERAATEAPTSVRWLLTADLATDRNRRLAAVRRAELLAPHDAHVLTALGHERRLGAYPADALPTLEAAIAANDALISARLEHALVVDRLGLAHTALGELAEASVRAPHSVALLRLRAAMADHAQLFDEAYSLRRQALALNADDVTLREAVAREARTRGDRETLRAQTDAMLASEPDRLSLYLTAAELIEASGAADVAHGVLDRAIEIAPDEPAFWKARGELEVRQGHPDEARASMRRALALSPQDATLRQHVEALEPPVPRADEAVAEASDAFLARRVQPGSAGATYKMRGLQELTVRTVYPNGLAGTFRQSVAQVLTEEGAQAARTFPIQYEPETQRFELRAARVYHPDGTVDESAGLEEYTLTGGASRMYYDSRAMVVTFPRLHPGDVVEIRWRVDDVSARNAFADYFGDLQMLQAEHPRAQVRYVLRSPSGRALYFHVPELPRLQHTQRDDGPSHIHDFLATDVAAVPPEEHAPGATERAAYLHVSTYRTWEEVGHWYWGLIQDQLHVDDRVRGIVREVTHGLTSPHDRVRAIYDWVIHNTRYVALEFGIHGFLPYRVPEVCARGFGDCKDKASTIVAMLREAGIDASIVLVRTRANGDIDASPASLAVFDHAIAYVSPFAGYPDGLYLDGTAQSSGIDELPTGDQGAMVLVVNQRGEAHLTHIPIYTPDRNQMTIHSDLTLLPSGGATLHVDEELRGPSAGGLRSTLEAQATRGERVEQALAGLYPGVHVGEVHVSDPNDVDHPAHLQYDAAIPEIGTRQGGTLLFAPTAPQNLTREYGGRSTRTSDVMLPGTSTTDDHRTIRIPATASILDVPAPVTVDTPFVHFELAIDRQGSALSIHRVMVYKVDRVPVASYGAFRESIQRIDDALSRRVTLRWP